MRTIGISGDYRYISIAIFQSANGKHPRVQYRGSRLFNPEIGTEEEYDNMIYQLDLHEMGQILDIVSNHMCISSSDNLWWMDVLENGPGLVFARTFDVDWHLIKKAHWRVATEEINCRRFFDVISLCAIHAEDSGVFN